MAIRTAAPTMTMLTVSAPGASVSMLAWTNAKKAAMPAYVDGSRKRFKNSLMINLTFDS